MRAEEFISSLSDVSNRNAYRFDQLRSCVPLGMDESGNFAVAHRQENAARYFHTCVTGDGKSDFIARLVVTLACLYERSEATFLVLSPCELYSDLLRLKYADVTVPYVRSAEDVFAALETVRTLTNARRNLKGRPRLVVALDGLDELPDAENDGTLQIYRDFLEAVGGAGEVVSGADLSKSVYGGYPGAFVGVGNCLVTPKSAGKADVTYVESDSSLTVPREIEYPGSPSLAETVDFFNSIG